jgi:hypothetical protein
VDAQFQIPKRTVLAEVALPGIEPLSFHLFLSERAQSHAGLERPSDLLNGTETFLPAADRENRVVFLRRDSVLTISVDAEAEFGGEVLRAEDLAPQDATSVRIEALIENGSRVRGTLVYIMPVGHRRLQDVLNEPARFLALRDGDRAVLVNKDRIVRVSPL